MSCSWHCTCFCMMLSLGVNAILPAAAVEITPVDEHGKPYDFGRQVGLLGRFIGVREPNLKYLGLENMVRLAEVPAVMETVSKCAAPWSPKATSPTCYL